MRSHFVQPARELITIRTLLLHPSVQYCHTNLCLYIQARMMGPLSLGLSNLSGSGNGSW